MSNFDKFKLFCDGPCYRPYNPYDESTPMEATFFLELLHPKNNLVNFPTLEVIITMKDAWHTIYSDPKQSLYKPFLKEICINQILYHDEGVDYRELVKIHCFKAPAVKGALNFYLKKFHGNSFTPFASDSFIEVLSEIGLNTAYEHAQLLLLENPCLINRPVIKAFMSLLRGE